MTETDALPTRTISVSDLLIPDGPTTVDDVHPHTSPEQGFNNVIPSVMEGSCCGGALGVVCVVVVVVSFGGTGATWGRAGKGRGCLGRGADGRRTQRRGSDGGAEPSLPRAMRRGRGAGG